MPDSILIQLRNDTAANWALYNPVLLQGEAGLELDTNKMKVGDGVTPWAALAYWLQPVTQPMQSDWNETDSTRIDYIKNKPTIPTVPAYPYGIVQSGKYFSPTLGITTFNGALAISANTLLAYPFYVNKAFSITAIGLHVAGNSSYGMKLLCYSDSGSFYPGTKLFDAGTVSSATASFQSNNQSYTFTANTIYWLVSIAGSGSYSGGFVQTPPNNVAWNPLTNMFSVSGTSTNNLVYLQVNVSGSYASPPSTFPGSATWSNGVNFPTNPMLLIA